MNKRQWLILGLGSAAAVLPLVLAAMRYPTPVVGPIVGPIVETSPGHYSQSLTYTSQVTPTWAALSAIGLIVLTGALVYKSRTLNG